MDAAANDAPVNLESVEMTSVVEEKRDRDGGGEESVVDPPLKKPRFDKEVNRVAEIVLVLSALRRIRGGKTPTELELELMVEAKSKLVEMCQEFPPKDIIGRDAIGAVIEDLGLNGKLKDQRLGFRAPKLTISEKLSLGKRKMEESKKHPVVSTTYTSPGRPAPATNVSMAHQWPNSEMKASTSSVNAAGSHFVRDASGITQSRVERPQFKAEIHTGASQVPVPAGNYYGNATSWSAQPHSSSSTISFGTPSDSKVTVQSSSRVTDPNFRPIMSQTQPGTFPGMKGVTYGQTSSPFGNNHHAEIAKIIHKVLQPRAKQNLLWNPPSREYMSKAMTCQMCQGTINEVETVLICDACEKGYHLKCLQANNMKGIPKSEWHCPRCVQLYNGKSFPPKYGRVMRSATTAKMSSSTAEVQLPAEKKVGKISLKVNQEAMPHTETAKPTVDSAMHRTIEAEDAAARSQTAEAEDASAISQTVKAKDASAISQTVEAEDASTNRGVGTNNETQGPVGNDAECDDPSELVSHSETLNPPKLESKEDPSKDDIEGSVSANCKDKDPKIIVEPSLQEENSGSQTEKLKNIEDPGKDVIEGSVSANCQDENPKIIAEPSLQEKSAPQTENLENEEDPSKDVIDGSVSANCQDKDPKIIAEPSLEEEDSAPQTENLPSQPRLQSNTDHSQQQNITPSVEDSIQKNVTEDREEDKSCE